MLVTCQLVGLSALEQHYAGIDKVTQTGERALGDCQESCVRGRLRHHA